MYTSLHSVPGSRARSCTIFDRSNLWPSVNSPDHAQHDFGNLAEGVLPCNLVATDTGWRRADSLRAGDHVLTFDNGMRKLASITTASTAPDPRFGDMTKLVHVPKGVLGNRRKIALLPSQLVLLECSYAMARYGDPFLLVPAGLLVGYKGITREVCTTGGICFMLAFATPEIIHVDGSTLLACHGTERANNKAHGHGYPRLDQSQTQEFRMSLFAEAEMEQQIDKMTAALPVQRAWL